MKLGSLVVATTSWLLHLMALGGVVFLFFGSFGQLYSYQEQFLSQYTLFALFIFVIHFILRILSRGEKAVSVSQTIIDVAMILAGITLFRISPKIFLLLLTFRQLFRFIGYLVLDAFEGKLFKKLTENPAVSFMLSFFFTIAMGAFLLMLPPATVVGQTTKFIDALFTSTSAVCVTGLAVVDTGSHFSLFGQLVILMLIQIGGLGIMTISTAFAILVGERLTVRIENLMQNVVGEGTKLDMFMLVKNVVYTTVVIELIGAFFLFFSFKKVLPSVSQSLYYAVFHSISGFCNAGFGLYPDSFMSFYNNVNINMVVAGLIITGGLGFSVLTEIKRVLIGKMSIRRISLHSKLVLITTVALIILGTVAFFFSEYSATMHKFSFPEKLIASYFQSVSCRTAGFNTIDETVLSKAGTLVSIVLMYIGASPGSTGGGIKTSTFAVLLLSVLALLRGDRQVSAFKRTIPGQYVREVMSLLVISLAFLITLIFLLMMIEPFPFDKIVFEAVSAFGTVGLSMGITSSLSFAGKLIIVALMYVGRIGPLTLVFAFMKKTRPRSFEFTEEKVAIG